MKAPNPMDWLGALELPKLTKEAEIAVYMVHNSMDPEDYFFLFDFEEFAERSQTGLFVRPALRIFTGRDDFSRTRFAAQFREVFQAEFDRMRGALADGKGKRGWLSWSFMGNSALELVGGLVANLVLAVALSVGRRVFDGVEWPRLLRGKSAEAKLADKIDETKSRVEDALTRIDVTIHRELYDHAYRDGMLGKISGMDRDAWPLPAYVRTHLEDGQSGSWW